jgi:hypothetical protein
MPATGGSIESVSLDGRIFPVAADAEAQRKLGGFENEVQANGDGTARLIKTRVPLSIDGLTIEVDDSRGDHEFLQELSDRWEYFAIAVSYPSGETYQGLAQLTGEMQTSSQSATASVNLMGPGILTRQL